MPVVLPTALAPLTESRLARRAEAGLEHTSARARERAALRQQLIAPVIQSCEGGLSVRSAAQLVCTNLQAGNASPELLVAVIRAGKVSAATLERWVRAYLAGGEGALAPKHRGRVRKDYGWETRAAALYRQPTVPACGTVAFWLRQEGYESATASRVRSYLQSLPSHQAETAPARVGRHYYAQNIRPHHRRDLTTIEVGELFCGDGHREDKYVQHPVTGKHFRPEIWLWLDARSERVVGWWAGDDESAVLTLYSFSSAIRGNDHVPVLAYADKGPGVTNKLMDDRHTGWFARLGITRLGRIPGNSKGNGLVEGWFRWYEERSGKRFESFCGHCRTDDLLARLQTKIKRGEINIPTWQQYLDAVRSYIAAYNAQPKEAHGGQEPDQVWAQLQRNPLHVSPELLLRPQREATVRRWEVRLLNRYYRHADLAAYERRQVNVEYDLHDEQHAWIRDDKQRLICVAVLVQKTPWARENVLADAREKSRLAKVARHQRAIDEIDARHRLPIVAAARVAAEIEHVDESQLRLRDELLREETQRYEELCDEETPEQRFARALALQGASEISAADARWLSLYQASAEYHSRRGLMEEFAEQQNKGPVMDRPFNT